MAETVLVTQTVNDVSVTQDVNKVVISSPGPQGPAGRTILNGNGAPANNLGREGDFYYDKNSAGDILETGIEYNNTSNLTLTMAQPFSGTAYLS